MFRNVLMSHLVITQTTLVHAKHFLKIVYLNTQMERGHVLRVTQPHLIASSDQSGHYLHMKFMWWGLIPKICSHSMLILYAFFLGIRGLEVGEYSTRYIGRHCYIVWLLVQQYQVQSLISFEAKLYNGGQDWSEHWQNQKTM